MPHKTIVRTSTEEKADGTIATFTERIEEQESSGLFEAWLYQFKKSLRQIGHSK